MSRYPEARIVGTPAAADKLNVVKALPRDLGRFDVNAKDGAQLATANTELERAGVSLVHIAGENFTEATVAIAHNHLLLVDLLYGCHDGVSLFDLSKEMFLKGSTINLLGMKCGDAAIQAVRSGPACGCSAGCCCAGPTAPMVTWPPTGPS